MSDDSGRRPPTRPEAEPPPTQSMIRNFRLLDLLPSMTPDEQLEVFEQVLKSPRPQVRQKALGIGAAILSEHRLLEYLRQEDDVRRNAAVEMLKLRRQRSFRLATLLLEDRDPDVVLQAVQVLSHLGDRSSLDPLVKALKHRDANVAQEAIVALGNLRDVRALPELLPFLAEDSWLQLAAIEAVGKLGSTEAVEDLEYLLPNEVLAPMVEEALARIGGLQAVMALARHWVARGKDADVQVTLQRLAEMLEALVRPPEGLEGLEENLKKWAQDERKQVRLAALRCLQGLRGRSRSLWHF